MVSSNERRRPTDSFDQIPESLLRDRLSVRCFIHEDDPDLCPDPWIESVDISPRDVRIDGYGYLHFSDHIPTECPECGDRVLIMNEEVVNFHV